MNRAARWAENMNRSLHHLSLKQRLLIYVLLLLLVSYLVTGMLLNLSITRQMEAVYTDFTRQTLSQAILDLESRIGNVDRIMGVMLADRSVQSYLRSPEAAAGADVRKLLGAVKDQYPEILGIALIDRNGTLLSNELYQPETQVALREPWQVGDGGQPSEMRFLPRPFGRNMAYYSPVSSDRILSVLKPIPGPDSVTQGLLCIDVDVEKLKETLNRFKLGKDGFVYILDPEGNVAYAPENPIVPRMRPGWFQEGAGGTFSRRILGVPYQIIYETSPYTGFRVVGVFPENETLQTVAEFRWYFAGITVLMMSLSVIGAQRISDTVIRPLEKLKDLMGRAEKGDLNVSFNPQYPDEIGRLGQQFDRMIHEIRNLIELVRVEQASKRQAELRALQAQINPHFLYNTFDTIHWMLKKYRADDVTSIITRLTELFRISLSGGRDLISLGDELRHVEAYLSIQKVRYEDQLSYSVSVADSLKGLTVHKLILQPLVENAIYHGIKNLDAGGWIEVTATVAGGDLVLRVRDNGPGIPPDKLDRLRVQLETLERPEDTASGKGFGLFNVNERIKLTYGPGYGVSLESDGSTGCTVSIKCPAQGKGWDHHGNQDVDRG